MVEAVLIEPREQAGADGVGELCDRRRLVLLRVADPEAAAEVEVLAFEAQLIVHAREELDHLIDRALECVGLEELASDVAVQPAQVEGIGRQGLLDGPAGLSAVDPDAELAVHLAGLNQLVRVCVDSGTDADEDVGDRPHPGGPAVELAQLDEAVNDDPADARSIAMRTRGST